MLALSLIVHLALHRSRAALAGPGPSLRRSSATRPGTTRHRGQATAEYALVLLGVATVALLLAAWAARSGKIGELFDAVVDQLISKAG